MGKVVAVCVSKEKGTRKTNVGAAKLLRDWGIENDAHGGRWHRQVSLLSFEKTEEFRQKGELLTTYLSMVPNNQDQVELDNYYTNEKITIALDKSLTPNQNAQRYFKKYQKLKKLSNT